MPWLPGKESHGASLWPLERGIRAAESAMYCVTADPKRLLAAGIAAACILLAVWLLANPAKDSQAVYYGVVQYSFLGGTNDLLVEIPRSGGVSIPDAERVTFHTGAEIDSLEAGNLVKITFPRGVIPGILESYPSSFTGGNAESIEVMGQGGFRLSYEGADQYLMALPFELAPEAEQGGYSGNLA